MNAVVVFSGGQDSTTCLYWAKKQFDKVAAITFSYGQKHVLEVDIARTICREAEVDCRVMELDFIAQLSHNALTDASIVMDAEKPVDALPNTFVPGRNLFFLSIAAVYARQLGYEALVTGVSQTDFSGYPDCREAFVQSLETTVNLALESRLTIHTPLMHLDKAQTWAMADELGVFDLVRNQTLTCYNGIVGDGCGHCPSCRLRQAGLEKYLTRKKGLK